MHARIGLTREAALAAVVAFMASGCPRPTPAAALAKAPELDPAGQTKCSVAKSQARPLIVEWPAADRGDLETQTRKGLVAVRYESCSMEVLRHCEVPGTYSYVGFTRKDDTLTIHDADELYATVPIGAAKLEAQLAKAGQLVVSMTMVGKLEASRAAVRADELRGACDGATHVITSLTTGAFELFAGAQAEVAGGATALGAGAGAKSASARETLNRDGDKAACDKAAPGDKEPPAQCGALVRIEVVPLAAPQEKPAPAANPPAPPQAATGTSSKAPAAPAAPTAAPAPKAQSSASAPPPSAPAARSGGIAILPFSGPAEDAASIRLLEDAARDALVRSSGAGTTSRVLSRETLAAALAKSGMRPESASEVDAGKAAAAELVLSGKIARLGSAVAITLRLVDVAGGKVLGSASTRGTSYGDVAARIPGQIEGMMRPPAAPSPRGGSAPW